MCLLRSRAGVTKYHGRVRTLQLDGIGRKKK